MGINTWLLGLLVCSSLLFSHHYGCTSSTGNDNMQQPHPHHKWRGPIGNRTITVDINGSGEFKSVQAAVDAVAQNNRVKVTILIHPGRYREKVLVPASKAFVTFQGVGEGPVIEWHDRASDPGPNGQQLRTYRTASVTVLADYFSARNITFKNTAPAPQPGMQGWQAAALRISGDKAYFGGCRFYGAQDTLCDDRGRHYFKDCFIQGSIDFIFGSARSMYKDCHIHSVATRIGSIAAHFRTSPADNTGFAFLNCRVTGSGPLYVGRAMSPFSTVVYSYTYFEDIVATGNPYEYDDDDDRRFSNNKNMTLFLGLYKCWGPGSKALAATPWAQQLDYDSAHRFLAKSFVNGRHWIAPSDA